MSNPTTRRSQTSASHRSASLLRSPRWLAAVVIGAVALGGCADVPNNYNERAEENFMAGCESASDGASGSSPEYCGCVWSQLEETVPWGDFNEFDKSQQTADEDGEEIEIPSGIQAAIDDCEDSGGGGNSSPSTTEGQTTTTEAG